MSKALQNALDNSLKESTVNGLNSLNQTLSRMQWVQQQYNIDAETLIDGIAQNLKQAAAAVWSDDVWKALGRQNVPNVNMMNSYIFVIASGEDVLDIDSSVSFVLLDVGTPPNDVDMHTEINLHIQFARRASTQTNKYPIITLTVRCDPRSTDDTRNYIITSGFSPQAFVKELRGQEGYNSFLQGALVDVEQIKEGCKYIFTVAPIAVDSKKTISTRSIITESKLSKHIVEKLQSALNALGKQNIWMQQVKIIPADCAHQGDIAAVPYEEMKVPIRADDITRSSFVLPFFIARESQDTPPTEQPHALCVMVEVPLMWRADVGIRRQVRITAMPAGALYSYLPRLGLPERNILAVVFEPKSVFVDIPIGAPPEQIAENIANAAANLFSSYANEFIENTPQILFALSELVEELVTKARNIARSPTFEALSDIIQASEQKNIVYGRTLISSTLADAIENAANEANVQLNKSEITQLREGSVGVMIMGGNLTVDIALAPPQTSSEGTTKQPAPIKADNGEINLKIKMRLVTNIALGKAQTLAQTKLYENCLQHIPMWKEHIRFTGVAEEAITKIQWARQGTTNTYTIVVVSEGKASITPLPQGGASSKARANYPGGEERQQPTTTHTFTIDLQDAKLSDTINKITHGLILYILQTPIVTYTTRDIIGMLLLWFEDFINMNREIIKSAVEEYASAQQGQGRGMKK